VTFPPALVLAALLAGAPEGFEKLPATAPTESAFVPPGWHIEAAYAGDLTQDYLTDPVLVLLDDDGSRALLVLERKQDDTLRVLGVNRGLLVCDGCAGSRGGNGAPVVEIARGVLIVRTSHGAGDEVVAETRRFRLDRKTGHLVLIGYDSEKEDADGTESYSANLVTGKCNWSETNVAGKKSVHACAGHKETPALEDVSSDK
jgi:hypothetical protein